MCKKHKKCQNKIRKIAYTIIIKLLFKFYDKIFDRFILGGCYV